MRENCEGQVVKGKALEAECEGQVMGGQSVRDRVLKDSEKEGRQVG